MLLRNLVWHYLQQKFWVWFVFIPWVVRWLWATLSGELYYFHINIVLIHIFFIIIIAIEKVRIYPWIRLILKTTAVRIVFLLTSMLSFFYFLGFSHLLQLRNACLSSPYCSHINYWQWPWIENLEYPHC